MNERTNRLMLSYVDGWLDNTHTAATRKTLQENALRLRSREVVRCVFFQIELLSRRN